MDARMFHSFVKTAAELQLADQDLPSDYLSVHAAVMRKFPAIEKMAAFPMGHAAEIAGLGALAVPSIQEMRGKPMDEKKKSMYELGGLGVLAAPSAYHMIQHFRGK